MVVIPKSLVASVHLLAQGVLILSITFLLVEIGFRRYRYFSPSLVFKIDSYNRFCPRSAAHQWGFQLDLRVYLDIEFWNNKANNFRILGMGDFFAFGIVPYEYNVLTFFESRLKS